MSKYMNRISVPNIGSVDRNTEFENPSVGSRICWNVRARKKEKG